MSEAVDNVMKDACGLSLQTELQRIAELDIDNIVYQSLSSEQTNELAKKINLLPLEYKNILFFRYCFKSTPSEVENILEIENAMGKLRYIQKILSGLMGLGNSWIEDSTMKEACELALEENMKDYDNTEILHNPNYSNAFRRKHKDIKIKQNPTRIFMSIAKKVAVIVLVCILSFSTVFTVNAEAREKVLNWIIEVFPEFSIFTPQNTGEDINPIELTSLNINYIPEGFELIDTNVGRSMLIYNYSSKDDQNITIALFSLSGAGRSYYDTENAVIKEFIFKDSQAYTWETDAMTYLIWHQDGIDCHISGNLNIDEIIKVAENILK